MCENFATVLSYGGDQRSRRISDAKNHVSNDDVPIIVIGTKSDCVKKRCVEREEVEAFIPEQIKYFETSAKYPHVSTSMSTIMENLVADIISNYDEIRDAQAEALKSRDGGCCVVS